MIKPYSSNTIQVEFSDTTVAWILVDTTTELSVTTPHEKYPGKSIIHIFMSENDAKEFLIEVIDQSKMLSDREIYPYEVQLLKFISGIEGNKDNKWYADGYAVHSPNEVYEWINQ